MLLRRGIVALAWVLPRARRSLRGTLPALIDRRGFRALRARAPSSWLQLMTTESSQDPHVDYIPLRDRQTPGRTWWHSRELSFFLDGSATVLNWVDLPFDAEFETMDANFQSSFARFGSSDARFGSSDAGFWPSDAGFWPSDVLERLSTRRR